MTRFNRALWRIMPMPLRYHLINRMCGKYNCRLFKSTSDFYAVSTCLGDYWTRPCRWIYPLDCWINLERAVLEYSMNETFR